MNYYDRFSFPPMGAFPRPGDIRRGHARRPRGTHQSRQRHRELFRRPEGSLRGLLHGGARLRQGTAIGTAMDQTWLMLGVLRGALSLCPPELLVRPNADHGQ